ncbi:hypothetical protein CGI42_26365, partial [Vibrio parahaemolyticus]
SRFAREQAQQAVKTLALEHDINIAKKATTIVLSQDAIDNLPLSKALVLNDETSLKDLFSDIAEEAFENKALLNYLDVSESNRNIPGNISVRLKFTDFPEMRTEVFKALNSISERMEELGIEPNGIKARTFGYDLDLKSFVRRAGNFEDVWVFESENEIISFANEDTQDQMLGELLTTKDNPSNASMKFFVEQNPDLEKVFNAWMAKQQKPSMKMDGLTM